MIGDSIERRAIGSGCAPEARALAKSLVPVIQAAVEVCGDALPTGAVVDALSLVLAECVDHVVAEGIPRQEAVDWVKDVVVSMAAGQSPVRRTQ